jgi:hypothetical protein
VIEYSFELKYELFELFLCKLKFAIFLIAGKGKTYKHIFRYYLDIPLHLEGVQVLSEFRSFLLDHLSLRYLMQDLRCDDQYEIGGKSSDGLIYGFSFA